MSLSPRIDRLERNKVVNGLFELWQRGNQLVNLINDSRYLPDRWFVTHTGTTADISLNRVTDVPPGSLAPFALELSVNTLQASWISEEINFRYIVEGYDIHDFVGNKIYVQFWVKSAKTGVHSLAVQNDGQDQSYVTEYAVDSADTWELKRVLVDVPPTASGTWDFVNGVGLRLFWGLTPSTTFETSTLNAWQSGNFRYSTNQVNVIDAATNEFHLTEVMIIPVNSDFLLSNAPNGLEFTRAGATFSDEITKAKRYYEKSYEIDTAVATATLTSAQVASAGLLYTQFTVLKRALPTFTTYSTNDGAPGNIFDGTAATNRTFNGLSNGDSSFGYIANAAPPGNDLFWHWVADAEF